MINSIYQINKGINQSIEFKGLKSQYIWYLGGGVLILMILYSVMYIVGLPTIVCLACIVVLGVLLVVIVYRLSHKYGEHGMMKALARKHIPKAIRTYERKMFYMK